MQFPNWNKKQSKLSASAPSSSTPQPQTKPTLPSQPEDFFHNLQTQCSTFFKHLSSNSPQFPTHHPLFNLNPASLQLTLTNILHSLQTTISSFTYTPFAPQNRPGFARVSYSHNQYQIKQPKHVFDLAMATEDIEERLAGVPVYALSNANEEFVLISGTSTGKSLGLFCFSEADADTLLEQMRGMDPGMRHNSKVVAVALNKVFQLKLNGIAFRFIPDPTQIKNAIKVQQSAGFPDSVFSGVPVFQSQSLVLKNEHKRYRPLFFRKEDLEESLRRASFQQKQLNPAFRQGDIEVSVLEEIIKAMKESSPSKWDDVVFIPPGYDVSRAIPQQADC